MNKFIIFISQLKIIFKYEIGGELYARHFLFHVNERSNSVGTTMIE